MSSEEEIEFEEVENICPVCNSKNTKVTQKIMDIPHFPQMWFFNLTCLNCHFTHNDFLNLSIKEPLRYIYHAENKDDYTSKIVRASNGTIRFPKLGAMIEPGPNAEGFINNIEGVLRDIQGKAKFLLKDAETNKERKTIIDYVQLLDKYIEENLPIEIIVEDPFGNSSIIPFDETKLEIIELSEEESNKLKTGYILFENLKSE